MSYVCKSYVFECQFLSNDSDFALDLCSVDLQGAICETRSRERVEILVLKATKGKTIKVVGHVTTTTHPARLRSFQREALPFITVYPVLLKRSYLNFKRRPNLAITKIMQVSSSGIILAFFFSPLRNDYASIQNRIGYIQQLTPLVFIGMLVCSIQKCSDEEQYRSIS
jgi:hypothetical protein